MSLNLGNEVMSAAQALRGDTNFAALRAAMVSVVHDKINGALESAPEHRVEATAYARALRDMWLALEAATQSVRVSTVKLPKPSVGQV